MWDKKAANLNIDDEIIEKLRPTINELLSETIKRERTIQNEIACPYCMKQDNKLRAVAGVRGDFVASVSCLCGKDRKSVV